MASINDLAQMLNAINKSSFHGDDKARVQVAIAAKKLVTRLDQPWESMYEMVLCQPMQVVALKTATDVKLWSCLGATPQSSAELAKKTGTDQGLLRRLLRILVAVGVVEEAEADIYVETDLSKALASSDGLVNGLDMYNTMGLKQMQLMPEYFKRHEYRVPEDIDQAPWKWVSGVPDYEGRFWQYIDEIGFTPKFNSFLSGVRGDQPSWPACWPVKEKLLSGWDDKSVLLVDVGGGKGRDLSNLGEAIQKTHPNAKLVLQDRPSVLEEAKVSGLHPQVDAMPHDFFEPNPVHGARAYFEHAVVHDWPDKEARTILTQMKAGMTPGYSKMLLMEAVMPESANEVDVKLACIDMVMALNFCALERTEKQWKALLESVGLKYIGYQKVYANTCIIEAEL